MREKDSSRMARDIATVKSILVATVSHMPLNSNLNLRTRRCRDVPSFKILGWVKDHVEDRGAIQPKAWPKESHPEASSLPKDVLAHHLPSFQLQSTSSTVVRGYRFLLRLLRFPRVISAIVISLWLRVGISAAIAEEKQLTWPSDMFTGTEFFGRRRQLCLGKRVSTARMWIVCDDGLFDPNRWASDQLSRARRRADRALLPRPGRLAYRSYP